MKKGTLSKEFLLQRKEQALADENTVVNIRRQTSGNIEHLIFRR